MTPSARTPATKLGTSNPCPRRRSLAWAASAKQQQGGLAFGGPGGGRDADVGHQPMPIVEQDMARVGEFRLFALALAREHRIGIRRGLMGVITPRFAVEIDRRIPRIVRRRLSGLHLCDGSS